MAALFFILIVAYAVYYFRASSDEELQKRIETIIDKSELDTNEASILRKVFAPVMKVLSDMESILSKKDK